VITHLTHIWGDMPLESYVGPTLWTDVFHGFHLDFQMNVRVVH